MALKPPRGSSMHAAAVGVAPFAFTKMASQIIGVSESFQCASFVRGHHVYHTSWTPWTGEVLVLKIEVHNEHDHFALAIIKDGEVIGHVPHVLNKVVDFFLKRDGNVAFCEVTGQRINRSVGLGIEVPCIYKFYGPVAYINKPRELLV